MGALHELLAPARLTEIVDVGANPIGAEPPYGALLRAGLCRVTGFEPQEAALRELLRHQGPNETYLPYALGDGAPGTLRVCQANGMSSLFEPDARALALFAGFADWGKVTARLPVQTRRLDEVAEIRALDYLKIDVQGSELAVFRGGRAKLAHAVAIQTAAGRITSMSSTASTSPGSATGGRSLGKTSRPRTTNIATCARYARPSWNATSWLR